MIHKWGPMRGAFGVRERHLSISYSISFWAKYPVLHPVHSNYNNQWSSFWISCFIWSKYPISINFSPNILYPINWTSQIEFLNWIFVSFRTGDLVQHFKIFKDDQRRYYLWSETFPSLNQLVEHHRSNSVSKTQHIVLNEVDFRVSINMNKTRVHVQMTIKYWFIYIWMITRFSEFW